MIGSTKFPRQQIPESEKNEDWKKQCLDWADSRSFTWYSPVRNSVLHKKINSDLARGVLHMSDLKTILKADSFQGAKIPDNIQHYPVMNGKIELLIGEEASRVFDHRVIVTNPTAISQMEKDKQKAIQQRLAEFLQGNPEQSESEDNAELDRLNDYFLYEYQDFREKRANFILNHYWKEQNFPAIFNKGFYDVVVNAEEIYKIEINGEEPQLVKLNPEKVHVFGSLESDRIEDSDLIILEEYKMPSEIYDVYGQYLTKADFEYLDDIFETQDNGGPSMQDVDEIAEFQRVNFINPDGTAVNDMDERIAELFGSNTGSHLPYDQEGRIRVLRVFWKSRRQITKVKHYNTELGEIEYLYYPKGHKIDPEKGEQGEDFWINEAWEGTKIGEKIYVNIRPMPIQFNSETNPSKCHFGIIGSVYQFNGHKPYSIVDKMKPFQYMYDVIHHRLNELIATSWGTMIKLDITKKPENWTIEKWMNFARKSKVIIENPANEIREGIATGKLAGMLNTASNGTVSAEQTQGINDMMNYLEYLSQEMSTVSGVSRQREGSIENRETVGGVERATMQSAMITKWLFSMHDDVKRRVLNAFLEVCKYCMKGTSKKWKAILDDGSLQEMDIDGDAFNECDYGLLVESGDGAQLLQQQLETFIQAGIQNQMINLSTAMKIYQTQSLSEKQRMVDAAEKAMQQQQQQAAQQQQEAEQAAQQAAMQQIQAQQDFQNMINERDNQTKIEVAKIQAGVQLQTAAMSAEASNAEGQPVEGDNGEQIALDVARLQQEDRHHQEDLYEKKREFDAKQNLDRTKMSTDKELKEKQLKKQAQKPKSSGNN